MLCTVVERFSKAYAREVRHISEQVEHCTDGEPKRTGNLERSHRILNVIENEVDI